MHWTEELVDESAPSKRISFTSLGGSSWTESKVCWDAEEILLISFPLAPLTAVEFWVSWTAKGTLPSLDAFLSGTTGTLRSEDGDGRESVAEKVNSRSFNLHRDYSKSLTLSNVGEPSWSRIPKNHIQVQKERGNFVVACVLPLYIVKLGIFTS